MKKTVFLLFLTWILLPLEVFAYGAIAIDDQPGDDDPAYGFSINESTKADAKASALRYCREYGGNHCRIIVWFETCGAVAISKKYRGYGYGRHKQKAIDDALEMCGSKRCEIVAAECEK